MSERTVGSRGVVTCTLMCLVAWGHARSGGAEEGMMALSARERFPLRAWVGAEPLPLQLEVVTGETMPSQRVLFEGRLTDVDGREAARQSSHLSVGPKQTHWIGFSLDPPDFGYYAARVRATGEDGVELATFDTAFGAVRPRESVRSDSVNSIFGVNFHYDHAQGDLVTILELMDRAGIRWLRDTVYWPKVEREAGVYEAPGTNVAAYRLARERYGIRTLVILCYDHPVHGRKLDRWAAYCREVVRQLSGIVDHFEIWNEPNTFGNVSPEEYVGLLKAGYEAVKEVNPRAFVVGVGGGSPGGWSGNYLVEIMKQGAEGFMDTFSVHPYTSPWPPDLGYRPTDGLTYDPSDLKTLVARLVNLDNADRITVGALGAIQKAKGLAKRPRLWGTEGGFPAVEGHAGARPGGWFVQARAVMRLYLTAAALPDLWERIFVYDFLCDGGDPGAMEHNFGMIGYDYSVRPAYVATATTSRLIDGRPFIKRLEHPDSAVRLYLFGPDDDPVLAAWCTEVKPEELMIGKTADGDDALALARFPGRPDRVFPVTLKVQSASVTAHDWQDRESRVTVEEGSLHLDLTPWPVFISDLGPADVIAVP